MKFNKLMILAFVALGLSACQKEYVKETIPGSELAGRWYVEYTVGGEDIYGVGHTTLLTYTTAAADGKEIIVTDEDHFWSFKAKTPANPAGLSFGSTDSTTSLVDGYDIKMIVKNGMIIPGAGRSKTGVVTDSIYMVVGFADDAPGAEYVVSGHRRTGFIEDEY